MPEIPNGHEEDLNPVTEVRKKVNGALVVERTHEKPVTHTETYVIAKLEAEIAKYEAVIAVWQAKIDPLKELVLEYNALEPK